MTKSTIKILVACLFVLSACSPKKSELTGNTDIIPKPLELTKNKGVFSLSKSTKIYIESSENSFQTEKETFISELKKASGISLESVKNKPIGNAIIIKQVAGLEKEEYKLDVSEKAISIETTTTTGLFYALQTLKQMLPVELSVYTKSNDIVCNIPAVSISDKPVFGWRGYMLDVSRHFFGKKDIKRVLDFMAGMKLNRFHWHLTDDQGWRIEIKKYPKLTSVGAWRVDHNVTDETVSNWWGRPVQKKGEKATYGGFYTQEDIKEIVAYAKKFHIEILPEIDVPGHSQEILAAYPEVSCDGKDRYVATGGVYRDNAICPSNEYTYKFLKEVLGEVMDLFPLNYIHIGGDECNKEGWKKHKECQAFIKKHGLKNEHELQSYFIKQVEKIVNAKGKNLVGWDEILEGGLAPNATVMSWRGETGGIKAAKMGHKVIMSPNYANYLDLKQGQSDNEPNLGYSEALLSTSYNYSVIPKDFTPEQAKFIMGTQGNLWTESISDWGKLTYMTFPRLYAVAENGWTPESNQSFDDFIERLKSQFERLKHYNVRFANSVFNVWVHHKGNGNNIEITLKSELSDPEIRYTTDGSEPTSASQVYKIPFTISETTPIKAAIFENGKRLGNVTSITYPIHKAKGAKVIYNSPFDKRTKAAAELALTDLNYGQLDVKGDTCWQGFTNDMDVIVKFKKNTDVNSVSIISLRKTIRGTYPPESIEIYGSEDGKNFNKIGESGFIKASQIQGRNRITTNIKCNAKALKAIQVKAKIVNPIPEGHHKAGNKSYLKVDEIIVL